MSTEAEAKPAVDEGAEWLDALFASSRERRLQMARFAVMRAGEHEMGAVCWSNDHIGRLADFEKRHGNVRDALAEIDAALPEMSEAGAHAVAAVLSRIGREVGYTPRR